MTRRELDPAAFGRGLSQVLNCVVLPRPIAWVSTRSADGVDNLAPHSYFTVASVDPPVVQFTSIGVKDSLRNCRETGEMVVALATEPMQPLVNGSGTDYPPGVSEFDALGIAREPSHLVAPYRVAGSPANLECRVIGEKDFGKSVLVFGQVVWVALDEAVLDPEDGLPRPELLRPVSRLGRNQWGTLGEVSRHRRVPYAELVEPPARPDGASATLEG